MRVDEAPRSATAPLPPWTAPETVALVLESSALSVHDTLGELMRHPRIANLGDDAIGTLWTVLAEALNNVVEHAYAEGQGEIGLRLWRDGSVLAAEVTDHGLPMPGQRPPEGLLPVFGEFEDLPEGNFGWHLIRAMTDCVFYDRIDGTNRLRFSIDTA